MIFLLVIIALVVGAPLLAAVLVTIASLREESFRSLAGRPPGFLAALARRLLVFRSGGLGVADILRRPDADRYEDDAGHASRRIPQQRKEDHDSFDHTMTLPRS